MGARGPQPERLRGPVGLQGRRDESPVLGEPRGVRDVDVGDPEDLRRSRVTVFFRLPLAVPHIVWLALWTVLAVIAAILNWFVTLFAGRPAASLHRFLSA